MITELYSFRDSALVTRNFVGDLIKGLIFEPYLTPTAFLCTLHLELVSNDSECFSITDNRHILRRLAGKTPISNRLEMRKDC